MIGRGPLSILLLFALLSPALAGAVTEDDRARFEEALSAAHANRLGEATQLTYDLLQVAPDFVDAHRLYIDLLGAQGRSEDALHFYRLALDANPNDAAAHYLYGRSTNNPTTAEEEFREALALDPAFAWAHHGLGAALAMRGQTDAAIASFERAIELQPSLAEAHSHLANLYLTLEREDDALAAYRRAIEVAPEEADAYFYLGAYLAHHERVDEARELLEEAARLDGNNPMIYLELGSVYIALGFGPEALSAFDEGLKLDPRDEYLRDLRAVADGVVDGAVSDEVYVPFRQGLDALTVDPEGALALFDEVIDQAPDFHLAHLNRGIGLAAVARNVEAEAAVRRAIELDPRYPESHAALAVVLLSEERNDEAEAALQQALALDPAHVEALRGLGMVYLITERAELASSYFLRASKLSPLDLGLKVELAGAYIQAANLPRAEETLREVLRADPAFNFARHQLAALLTEMERYDEALAELETLRRHVAAEVNVQALIDEVSARRRAALRESAPRLILSQIFVKDRSLADQILAKDREGEDFAALARAHSIGPTAAQGGDIGEVSVADMQPSVAAAVEALAVGQTTTVLEMPTGFLILKRTK
jgi:tetratricopeptide (TPR) repeat protein